ncbi:recombination regulator RecX [Neisseriaceae bacterium TC5R-5]|nr:recombination regulator RecX [Neisseriaceae bacterium TC5R-5]
MTKSLKARAVDLLARREYSRRELEQRLAPFAESSEQLQHLLDDLVSQHWQSDQRFAEQYTQAKGNKYGSRRLEQTMRQRGIAADTIREVLHTQDDLSVAQAQWQKKFGRRPDTPQEQARQLRFLASRGFPMAIIRQVLSGHIDDTDFPADEE